MNRFKFRAWDKKQKVWVDSKIIGVNLDGEIIAPDETYLKHNPADLCLMQCTGLKDKNGKLIYEGDIVKVDPESDGVGEIRWKFNGFVKHYEKTDDGVPFDFPIEKMDPEFMEVIGNIYGLKLTKK